jgi:hypothetical protein
MRELKIGIDNGGCLSVHSRGKALEDEEGHVSDQELNMPGARDALLELKRQGHRLFLESFAGRKRATRTHDVLAPLGLFEAFHFTKQKRHKAAVCEHYGLDVFVDDSPDVVAAAAEQNPSMLVLHFTGDPSYESEHEEERESRLQNVIRVGSWEEALVHIGEFAEGSGPAGDVAPQEVGLLTPAEIKKMLYVEFLSRGSQQTSWWGSRSL